MTQTYTPLDTQAGLEALDNVIKRQRQLIVDLRDDDPETQTHTYDSLNPDTIQTDDALVAELDALISDPSFAISEHFTPKSIEEITADFYKTEAFTQQSETPAKPVSPFIAQILDELSVIEKPKREKAKKEKPVPVIDKRTRRKRGITGMIFYLVLAVIVVMAIHLTSSTGGAPRSVFGYSAASVLTGSMQSVIPQGSLVIVKHVDPNTLHVGDDVSYMYNADTSVTHRIVAIIENYTKDGQRGFQTQGVENPDPDKDIVSAQNIVGKVIWHVPVVGAVTQFIGAHELLIAVSLVVFGGMLYLLYIILRWMFKSDKHNNPQKQPSVRKPRKKSTPVLSRS